MNNQELSCKVFSFLKENQSSSLQLVALPGGSTAVFLYPAVRSAIEQKLNYRFLMTDERCVPIAHNRSNYGAYLRNIKSFGDGVSINILSDSIEPELYTLQIGYIFLGFGLDGHFASIFNDSDYGAKNSLILDTLSPEGEHRKSISLNYMRKAKKVFVVFDGEKKKNVLLEGDPHYMVNRLISDPFLRVGILSNG